MDRIKLLVLSLIFTILGSSAYGFKIKPDQVESIRFNQITDLPNRLEDHGITDAVSQNGSSTCDFKVKKLIAHDLITTNMSIEVGVTPVEVPQANIHGNYLILLKSQDGVINAFFSIMKANATSSATIMCINFTATQNQERYHISWPNNSKPLASLPIDSIITKIAVLGF